MKPVVFITVPRCTSCGRIHENLEFRHMPSWEYLYIPRMDRVYKYMAACPEDTHSEVIYMDIDMYFSSMTNFVDKYHLYNQLEGKNCSFIPGLER